MVSEIAKAKNKMVGNLVVAMATDLLEYVGDSNWQPC